VTQNSTTDARRDDADGVITVTFTRDDKLNAINHPMIDVLDEALTALETDDAHRVLVIRAEGRYFTAGKDLRTIRMDLGASTDGVIRGSNIRRDYKVDGHHDLLDRFEMVEKPVILAAHGPCLGLGVEMSVSCDFRLAADTATFGLPEVAKLGALPGSGGISRLTRLVGVHWAKWISMAGQIVSAEQALTIGLVHAVYPLAEFDEAVAAFAKGLAAQSREALGLAKVAIDTAAEVDRRTAREVDRLAQTLLFQSAEYTARMAQIRAPR
jgi:enoyl-CoA hydratase